MGSYISIGMVTGNCESKEFLGLCKRVFDVFDLNVKRITFKYPLDNECLVWKEITVPIGEIDSVLSKCYLSDLCELNIDYLIEKRCISGVLFKIKKGDGYQGALFEIPEENFDIADELDILEYKIEAIIGKILHLGFEYGFCDNEADIEYSKEKIMSMDSVYSILLINNKLDRPKIKLAPWKIDGLTKRSYTV